MGTSKLSQDKRHVYRFGVDKVEASRSAKELLGGKGASLADMVQMGLPVPPGFTITTDVCAAYRENKHQLPDFVWEQTKEAIGYLEEIMNLRFADTQRPLLVSVRSGAPASMPGMMDTILNLGLCEAALSGLIELFKNERFVYDSYRRFISMYADVVLGISNKKFEKVLTEARKAESVAQDYELSAPRLKNICHTYLDICKKENKEFPQDPWDQLRGAIGAVFDSWNSSRAVAYRSIHRIPAHWGTAVNVQSMVFGNMGDDCATGVCFTRNPATGEKKVFGEYLVNAQGEDVVAGIRTPGPLSKTDDHGKSLEEKMPAVYTQLIDAFAKLEAYYTDMQDVEFTVQEGTLYLLQTRAGKRTAKSAVKIAIDLVTEGMISEKDALMRVDPYALDQLLHPSIHPDAHKDVLAKGLAASPGVVSGKIVFDADTAKAWAAKDKVILVRHETSPEDIEGMHAAQGILTAFGGMTSHAAVVARGMGKSCVCGCAELVIHDNRTCDIGTTSFKEGDIISLDGSTGEVLRGEVKTVEPSLDEYFDTLMRWSDKYRLMRVRANADTPEDAQKARSLGAEGIGLTRTEHMFFNEERIHTVRQMILSDDLESRKKMLSKLKTHQRKDFLGIFREMSGLPVTIRLLDPPLHEFLPREDKEIKALAKTMHTDEDWIRNRIASLEEVNPMLGHRGSRVGVSYPEVYEMQAEAIIEAALELKQKEGLDVGVEIMVPLIFADEELGFIRKRLESVIENTFQTAKARVAYKIGTMIEIPRAALVADKIAEVADFFSFGTNDLTQMTLGISRDDSGRFLPTYVSHGILPEDPFVSIDEDGVGQLMMLALSKARLNKFRKLHYGICGEHGGDPRSINFCQKLGLDYVSCSPLRVPIARLASAQARLRQ